MNGPATVQGFGQECSRPVFTSFDLSCFEGPWSSVISVMQGLNPAVALTRMGVMLGVPEGRRRDP